MPIPPDHPLFLQFPLSGKVQTSAGLAPRPYHIYDGYGAFIGGSADLGQVRDLLQQQELHPLQTASGRAVLGIWVCNFTAASLGAHTELQFSIFVTRQPAPPLPDKRLALSVALLERPEVHMLCHGLWNNTALVSAYNREHLHLPARLAHSELHLDEGMFTFDFYDAALETALLSGALDWKIGASLSANLELMTSLGFGGMQRLAQAPWIGMQVVNPISRQFPRQLTAQTYTKNTRNRLRYFDAQRDQLEIRDDEYKYLDFKPLFVQAMDGFRFVYLDPE